MNIFTRLCMLLCLIKGNLASVKRCINIMRLNYNTRQIIVVIFFFVY